jgi:hypothetical protein
VRERVDSPKETELRLLLVLAGFPEPETNVDVLDDAGGWIARADLTYRAFKIALEYVGKQHANDPKQWARDIRRRELLDAAGWRTIVITARDLARFPRQTLTRVALVLHERHCQDIPTLIAPDMSMYASPGSDPRCSSPAGRGTPRPRHPLAENVLPDPEAHRCWRMRRPGCMLRSPRQAMNCWIEQVRNRKT